MFGLNQVNGRADKRFVDWLTDGKEYIINQPLESDKFSLYFFEEKHLYKSIAHDVNRFGSSLFETINDIFYDQRFPQSNAWKCVKAYYAAYYSAHAILRMMGIMCVNLEKENLNKVERIADAYHLKNGININSGYYKCFVDKPNLSVVCERINASGKQKGSHEQLWEVFLETINTVLASLSLKGNSKSIQDTILILFDLRDNLTYMGCNGGSWLSKVRNDINYKHLYGVWYPYNDYETYYSEIENLLKRWKSDPSEININAHKGKMILRYISTCVFLVSLFKELAIDMASRCPKGHSFLEGITLSYFNKSNTIVQ